MQVALEKPRPPRVPERCPRCGCRWYSLDVDGDWLCLDCAETLVVWSSYRYELRRWLEGNKARAEGYRRRDEAA